MPLHEVPDTIFADGSMGLGQAIDPVGHQLVAPCPGEIVQLHRCNHALTLRRADGVEILMHLGIDSAVLNGEGFRALVRVGDRVEVGDVLLAFDPDRVATRARSLVSVILILEDSRVSGLRARAGRVRQGEEWLSFHLAEPPALPGKWLRLPNPGGLHARPASRLVQLVRELPGQVEVESRRARASARSIVALLSLDLACGDSIRLVSNGLNQAQVQSLESQILAGLGDDLSIASPVDSPPELPEPGDRMVGVIVSRGLAMGPVFHWLRPGFEVPEKGRRFVEEERCWQKSLRRVATAIEEFFARAPLQQRGIFAAHREILQDPGLLEKCRQGLSAGYSAAWSWQQAYLSQARVLAGLANPVLAARANDVRDVGERVLRALLELPSAPAPPDGCILVADDLYPSEILQLSSCRVHGICLARGGIGSHLALLARSLDVPSLCGLGEDCLGLPIGSPIVVDADRGVLWPRPSLEQMHQVETNLQERAQQRLAVQEPAFTRDQQRIYVGVHDQLEIASEVDFLICSYAASPEDYQACAKSVGEQRRMIVQLPGGAPFPELRACSDLCRLGVALGMVRSLSHWRATRAELKAWIGDSSEIGLVVDVPAIAILAHQLVPEADFLVLDVSSLVQHTLGIEGARPEMAGQSDALHPAVIHLLHRVAEAGSRHGKPLFLCQSAHDRDALPLWLGLPVDHVCVEPAVLAATKAEVRGWRVESCRRLLTRALELAEPEEIRQLVREYPGHSSGYH